MEIKGIKYVAPCLDNSGYAQASRGNILALNKLGVPVTVSPISFEAARPDLGENGEVLYSLIDKNIDYNIVLIHTTPEFWEKNREHGKVNVGYTVWETDRLHSSWPTFINKNVEKVIVPCKWNVDVFKECGIEIPIGVVPHGINTSKFDGILPRKIDGISDSTFVFYDIFQFTERKHPAALLKAYWSSFQNGEDVALVLKTYRSDYTESEKNAVRNTILRLKEVSAVRDESKRPKVYLLLDMLSNEEIIGLHKRGNCFISLNRGEGWGLSPFSAGAIGNPVIVTGFGGVLEYAKPDNSYLVDYLLTPVWGMKWSPWYSLSENWAEPGVTHAANLMKHVYNNREEAKHKGLKLKEYISNNFTWDHVGKKLIEELESIR